MKRKLISMVLVLAVVLSTSVGTAAANTGELNPIYTYTGGGMTFEKVSHASTPVENPDGIVDYLGQGKVGVYVEGESELGKGDRGQSYSYASAVYGDWVYINTMYGGLSISAILGAGFAGMDADVVRAIMDTMYNGNLYYGEPDQYQAGGVLLKFNVKTGETKLLMSRETNGLVPTFRNACTMGDKLYFVGMMVDTSTMSAAEVDRAIAWQDGQPCLYEIDPATDTFQCIYKCVDMDGYRELVANNIFPSTRAVGVYKDCLVTGGIEKDGSFIAISADPSAGQDSFVRIAEMEDLFNYPAYHRTDVNAGGGIYQVIEFNDSLYVVVCSGSADTLNDKGTLRSYALVRGDCSGDPTDADSWTWTAVIGDTEKDGARYTFGIDASRISTGACSLEVYGDHLYIGEYNDVSNALQNFVLKRSFLTQATNLEQSINLYRMDKDENIEMVVGDPNETFPEGSLTGLGSGFGNHMNQYTWQTIVYEGKMYLSTMDTTTLLKPLAQFTNGDLLEMSKEEWQSQINYIRVLLELVIDSEELAGAISGLPVVMSPDGSNEEAAEIVEENLLTEEPVEITEEDALRMVEAAIADAIERRAETMPVFYEAASDESGLTLTEEQIRQLIEGIMDGTITEDQIPEEVMEALSYINLLLESLTEALETIEHEAFLEIYNELIEMYEAVVDALPDPIKGAYNVLIKIATAENIEAIGRSIQYMIPSVAGFDLFEIEEAEDGSVTVKTITENGFGDRYNHGLRIFAETDDYLLIGTANPFYGTQLWRTPNSEPAGDDGSGGSGDSGDIGGPGDADDSDKDEAAPPTGDASHYTLWLSLLAASGLVLMGTVLFVDKKRKI